MNNFSLTSYLTSNVDITTQEVELLSANCKLKRLKRGEYILQQGDRRTVTAQTIQNQCIVPRI